MQMREALYSIDIFRVDLVAEVVYTISATAELREKEYMFGKKMTKLCQISQKIIRSSLNMVKYHKKL